MDTNENREWTRINTNKDEEQNPTADNADSEVTENIARFT
jgi:hypothetical protein